MNIIQTPSRLQPLKQQRTFLTTPKISLNCLLYFKFKYHRAYCLLSECCLFECLRLNKQLCKCFSYTKYYQIRYNGNSYTKFYELAEHIQKQFCRCGTQTKAKFPFAFCSSFHVNKTEIYFCQSYHKFIFSILIKQSFCIFSSMLGSKCK